MAKTAYNTDLENSYESGSCPEVNPCWPSSRSKSWPTIPASQHATMFSRSSHKIRFYWNKPQYTAIRFFRLLKSQLIWIHDKMVYVTMWWYHTPIPIVDKRTNGQVLNQTPSYPVSKHLEFTSNKQMFQRKFSFLWCYSKTNFRCTYSPPTIW
jgi:hypothetical protein